MTQNPFAKPPNLTRLNIELALQECRIQKFG